MKNEALKWILMYLVVVYAVACADNATPQEHTTAQRIARALLFPLTLTSWFRSGNQRLHRLISVLWVLILLGWGLSLMSDRL